MMTAFKIASDMLIGFDELKTAWSCCRGIIALLPRVLSNLLKTDDEDE
jgi:hypothetical protein